MVAQANVLQDIQEKIGGRVSGLTLCGCTVQRHALDLLRPSQDKGHLSYYHQLLWVCD